MGASFKNQESSFNFIRDESKKARRREKNLLLDIIISCIKRKFRGVDFLTLRENFVSFRIQLRIELAIPHIFSSSFVGKSFEMDNEPPTCR